MRFVLRDDDTCAFTEPDDLLACYRSLFESVPISLSVTPFRIPGAYAFVPRDFYGSNEPVNLDRNGELVSFLREFIVKGQIHAAIHGYHHAVYDGVPEYVAGTNLLAKTHEAKTYLSGLLGEEIRTFVPPHNAIGKEGLRAVIKAGLNLVNTPSLWSWKVRDPNFEILLNMPRFYWHRKLWRRAYPHVLDFRNHKEVTYHSVGPGSISKELIDELDYCYSNGGVYVLATHYHAFDRPVTSGGTVRDVVYTLVDRAHGKRGVSFVGINDIW